MTRPPSHRQRSHRLPVYGVLVEGLGLGTWCRREAPSVATMASGGWWVVARRYPLDRKESRTTEHAARAGLL
jgi:hypothetical protein